MTTSSPRRHIHPFPARMAPELALEKIETLTGQGAVVLDPMCGSGTVPRLAAMGGRRAIACDMDPLAVMITRTTCKPQWSRDLASRAKALIAEARELDDSLPDWIQGDPPTSDFVHYWFAEPQRHALSKLARLLVRAPVTDDPLRVALSRLIITKEGGASLARDTAHSRPHRVRLENNFDVHEEFIRSASKVAQLVEDAPPQHRSSIRTVDARSLGFVASRSVDLIVTSPPYLNAIDYLRGHRLSLVWLGHRVGPLRELRGEAIGAERAIARVVVALREVAVEAVPRLADLEPREQRMIWRFTRDLDRVCRSLARVSKEGGHLVFVVADSQLRGVPVSNSALCRITAERHGFRLRERVVRPLPAQHRYLPPPNSSAGDLGSRMREEVVFTFDRVPHTSD